MRAATLAVSRTKAAHNGMYYPTLAVAFANRHLKRTVLMASSMNRYDIDIVRTETVVCL